MLLRPSTSTLFPYTTLFRSTVATGIYPAHLETEVATRDGSLVHVRPVRPEDTELLLGFLQALSVEDRYLRFFSFGGDLRSEEHTSELQSRRDLVCRLLLEKK